MSSSGDFGLWVWDDQDECDGSPVTAWDQGYRPGPPRIVPRARSPPSPRNTPAGFLVAANPGCSGLDRQRVSLVFQEELPATLLEVSFPPFRTSTPGGV